MHEREQEQQSGTDQHRSCRGESRYTILGKAEFMNPGQSVLTCMLPVM
jgi:hypothetical protein